MVASWDYENYLSICSELTPVNYLQWMSHPDNYHKVEDYKELDHYLGQEDFDHTSGSLVRSVRDHTTVIVY